MFSFIEKNYQILLFLLVVAAAVFLFSTNKTGVALALVCGYLIGLVANIKTIAAKVEKDKKVFEDPEPVEPPPTAAPKAS